jgi:hypothetical protein
MCTLDPQDSDSYANWGLLVKTWVTGTNQFGDDTNYSIPTTGDTLRPLGAMTKDQFRTMLRDANVDMSIPDRVTRFVFVQDDDVTVIVRIPTKKVVEDVQGLLEGLLGGAPPETQYPLPHFYTDNWPRPLDRKQLLMMHCQRIGEYTINTCG